MSTCTAELGCAAVIFNADPDIAGIGVVLAFLVSAWSSLLIIAIEYFSLHGDDVNFNSNALDGLLKNYIWKLTKRFNKPWTLEDVQPAILLVSDQQLITGIAILSVGYIQHCTIAQYHFYIVYLLGFISSQVFDASLHALNLYVNRRPSMKLWRAILMSILFGMLILNTFVVDHDEFLEYDDDDDIWYLGSSTQCVWNNFIGSSHYRYSLLDLIISLTVLIWAYFGDMQLLYPHIFKPLAWILKAFQAPLLGLLRLHDRVNERMSGAGRIDTETSSRATFSLNLSHRKLYHLPFLIAQSLIWMLLLPSFTLIEILTSRIVDLWRIYSALVWATISVTQLKRYASSHQSIQGSEGGWGFGQILPLLLLLLPATSVLEIYQEALEKRRKDKATKAGVEFQHLVLRDSNERLVHEEPALLYPGSTFEGSTNDSTLTRNRSQQGQDTESQAGLLDNPTATYDTLQGRMYRHKLFRVWITFCTLAAFVATTYGAINGYSI